MRYVALQIVQLYTELLGCIDDIGLAVNYIGICTMHSCRCYMLTDRFRSIELAC